MSPSRSYGRIRIERGRGALRITLANPKRRNVLGSQMINELLYAIEDAQADDDVRFLTITGEGKVFSAGGDLAQMHSGGDSVRPSADRPILPHKGDYADLLNALLHCEKPVIARVNGHALGSAVGMIAACTFSVALMDAQFGTPEIHAGLFPMVAMALLSRVIPRRRLLEMVVLGEKLDATEAARIGLVGQTVEPGELDEAIRTIETQILHKSPTALRLGLRAFAAQQDLELARAFPLLRERFGEILTTEDAQEGLNAFLEKRPPKWKGTA